VATARTLLFAVLAVASAIACGPPAPGVTAGAATSRTAAVLPDVRLAKDRPPVVLVVREGDPAAAVAAAIATGDADEVDPEPAAALAGVVEARLTARGLRPSVTPAWDGYRVTLLASGGGEAKAAAEAIVAALLAPIGEGDLAAAKKKVAALAGRPLRDPALAHWARCVGAPYGIAERAAKAGEDLTTTQVEAWRARSHALGTVAIAVTGTAAIGEAVAAAIASGPAFRAGAAPFAGAEGAAKAGAGGGAVDVYDAPAESPSVSATIHVALPVATPSAAPAIASALGDPRGPLATRLAGLDVPIRLREIAGTAHARGGCVGVVLEAGMPSPSAPAIDLAALVADAVALVDVEAAVHLGEGDGPIDGRALARRAGNARESAERAAWWALADPQARTAAPRSVALGVPKTRGTGPAAPARDALAAAIERAAASWKKPVVDGRTRIESGQGETWVLVGSPCGTESEAESDAGATALVVTAAAEAARTTPETTVEPWVAADGAGLVAHGPPLAGESASAHARRLADVAARAFAADAPAPAAIGRARADLARRATQNDAASLGVLGSALAPGHPAWIVPTGLPEPLLRTSDAVVVARSNALRSGPLRVAVLADGDAAQGAAAVHAADRWVDRRTAEGRGDLAPRACPAAPAAGTLRPGTYAIEPRAGAIPEAYVAYPFPANDEPARAAANALALALDGDGGLLDKALGGTLALRSSARVVGWPRAPALVLRIVAAQAQLDGAVMQARALVDRLHKGALGTDVEQALAATPRTAIASALDPRIRLVATFRGDPIASPAAPSLEDVKAFASKNLGEDALVVVAVRPSRKP
jgi:hypothetical protein